MKKIKIGIIGYGTVGSAVGRVLKENSAIISERSGVQIVVSKICDPRKLSTPYPLTPNPSDIINDPDISVVVETMGGVNPAKGFILAALRAGKHVVTSNKELIALHMA